MPPKNPFEWTLSEKLHVAGFLNRLEAADERRSRLHKAIRKYVQTSFDRDRPDWCFRLSLRRLDFVFDPIPKDRWHNDRGPLPEGHWFKELSYNRFLRIRWTDLKRYEEMWGKPHPPDIAWKLMVHIWRLELHATWP